MQRLGAPGGAVRCDHAGFDLFSFPGNLRLPAFDVERFAAWQAARGRRRGGRAVLSHHEQFGALAAALVAERLGLPGAKPESILAAQHKLHARRVLAQVAPDANLRCTVLEEGDDASAPGDLDYPVFVKPVKGAFSVLARRVEESGQLRAHMHFDWSERWLIRQLVEPFERVCRARLPQAGKFVLSVEKGLKDLSDIVEVQINGHSLGVRPWAPYRFVGETAWLRHGRNRIVLRLTNTLAGLFAGQDARPGGRSKT